MNPENIFLLANCIFVIGTARLFIPVIKNRNALNDFDMYGAIITALALSIMLIGYAYMAMYIAMTFMLPTLAFWLLVSICTVKQLIGGST